jgi:hypothetical protein
MYTPEETSATVTHVHCTVTLPPQRSSTLQLPLADAQTEPDYKYLWAFV